MSRQLNKLSPAFVRNITDPGKYSDGGGLWLMVPAGKSAGKRWFYRYNSPVTGKRRDMGLGSFATVSLKQAREKATTARAQVASGVDPLEARDEIRTIPTFAEMVDNHIAGHGAAWRSGKHRQDVRASLENHAGHIMRMPVDQLEEVDILKVLRPIWLEIPETAFKIRGRIETILDAAKVQRFRSGDNPARWRGHLEHLLRKPPKLTKGHMPTVSANEIPRLVISLQELDTPAARCAELVVLTLCRRGEAAGARWSEFDLGQSIWTIPAERTKAGREHQIPLPPRAIEILEEMKLIRESEYVFPGQASGSHVSGNNVWRTIKNICPGGSVHGLRSTFRDWCGDTQMDVPREVAEMAIAHAVGSTVERAYRRLTALDMRRDLMLRWADHCAGKSNVIPIKTENLA